MENLDPKRINVTKTYSLTLSHVNRVKEMADEVNTREGKFISEGEIVRRAIDLLYASIYGKPLVETEPAESEPAESEPAKTETI